jgi:uncharacterized protein YegP (UPF0339 family)
MMAQQVRRLAEVVTLGWTQSRASGLAAMQGRSSPLQPWPLGRRGPRLGLMALRDGGEGTKVAHTNQEEGSMPGKFEIVPARGGQYAFRLRAPNGNVILASQTYTSRSSARRGIVSVQANCAKAGSYERKKARNGKDNFVLKARNQQVIGKSEMYNTPRAMESGIASVMKNGATARVEG